MEGREGDCGVSWHLDLSYPAKHRQLESQKAYMELKRCVMELDEQSKIGIHQDWRLQLIDLSTEIAASDARKEWFLHMLMQEHELLGLIDLVNDFNNKQFEPNLMVTNYSAPESIDFFDIGVHQIGLLRLEC